MKTFFRVRVIQPVSDAVQGGITADVLAMSLALGVVAGTVLSGGADAACHTKDTSSFVFVTVVSVCVRDLRRVAAVRWFCAGIFPIVGLTTVVALAMFGAFTKQANLAVVTVRAHTSTA